MFFSPAEYPVRDHLTRCADVAWMRLHRAACSETACAEHAQADALRYPVAIEFSGDSQERIGGAS
ncbi:hypothetical protein ADM96_09260 [Burkholderia sp. ST111]|nr:hypothetical protein ADM96_09260 [Burkholderia sp. ST111]